MRFHVVALPHTVTSKDYNACAYTQKVFNFCKMMTDLGHEVIHYGAPGSTVPCSEHVDIVTKQERMRWFGENNWKKDFFSIVWDSSLEYWDTQNKRAAAEINKRLEKKDFVCLIGGYCQKPIADRIYQDKAIVVEYGIGYQGVFSKFKIFESYAQMHKVAVDQGGYDSDGSWMDAVIPNYFDPNDFPFSEKKEDYFLFIGRMIKRKGPQIAADVTREIGAPLIMAGQGVTSKKHGVIKSTEVTVSGHHITHVGYADIKKRGELMSKARAVFVPSWYLEPFGGVAVEAQFCGTPVISTDWGAFPETVQHGVTGYRCRTMAQFVEAAKQVHKLDPYKIRDWAVDNYSLKSVAKKYEDYFNTLLYQWDDGWNTVRSDVDLDAWMMYH